MYHMFMFFCLLQIIKQQNGLEVGIKNAFAELGHQSGVSDVLNVKSAQSNLKTTMMLKLLSDQQDLFRECSNTFEHGILVAFTAYHAIYCGMMMFKVLESRSQKTE